jgi:protein gp37
MNLTEMIGQERIAAGQWWSKGCGLQLMEGCTKVSPGCDNCRSLAAANMRRFNPNPKVAARYDGTVTQWTHRKEGEPPNWTGQVNLQWQDLDKIGRKRSPSVYTFWTDLFHPGVPDEFVDAVMGKIHQNSQHFYIICTKRPERALGYCQSRDFGINRTTWHQNRLMLMTTVENQAMADKRLPVPLQISGVLHGVSYEPALGAMDFCKAKRLISKIIPPQFSWIHGRGIDWIICGGETGPHARPSHPDWFRQARDQAVAAGVPFFLKSLGEWAPAKFLTEEQKQTFWQKKSHPWGTLDRAGNWFPETTPWNGRQGDDSPEGEYVMYRVGKKAAGRTLDGRTWDEVPMIEDKP